MSTKLEGRVAFVTGSSRGIGAASPGRSRRRGASSPVAPVSVHAGGRYSRLVFTAFGK